MLYLKQPQSNEAIHNHKNDREDKILPTNGNPNTVYPTVPLYPNTFLSLWRQCPPFLKMSSISRSKAQYGPAKDRV